MATVTSGYVKTVNYAASNERQGLLGYLNYFTNGVQDVLLAAPLNPLHSFGESQRTLDYFHSRIWYPHAAKSTVISILKNIKQGRLYIESLGETYEFGEPFTVNTAGPPNDLKATIRVLDEGFWTRIFLHSARVHCSCAVAYCLTSTSRLRLRWYVI